MKIVVCIRKCLDGEINPFDACAYEAALQVENAEVVILSMGTADTKDFLTSLTRLGAKRAILLSDRAFAGADTLATAYALAQAIKKLSPDLVFCGRQTLVGDTAQTGVMLSQKLGFSLITNVMAIKTIQEEVVCDTRNEGEQRALLPALITIERINNLRFPRLGSKTAKCEVWSAEDIGADIQKCGLSGSPTRVISTYENESGKRKCTFIKRGELADAIAQGLKKYGEITGGKTVTGTKLDKVLCVGDSPLEFAKTISDDICVIGFDSAEAIAKIIKDKAPNAVLFGSDALSKRLSAQAAAILDAGLCADCTALETDGRELFMIRPALSGNVIAKIKSIRKPAMATVRTADSDTPDIMVGIGYGARECIERVKEFAHEIGAQTAASRKMVDNDFFPYEMQVGLTGKTAAPPVYVAIGISGAIHHTCAIEGAKTIIAINPDKNARIFEYADYGILEEF